MLCNTNKEAFKRPSMKGSGTEVSKKIPKKGKADKQRVVNRSVCTDDSFWHYTV